MSPAVATMDSTLPSSSSSLFNIPQLAEDGTNWITYKERMLTAIGARGLTRYIDGRAVRPALFKADDKTGKPTKPDGTPASEVEIEERDTKIDEYCQKDAYVKQHIFSTITDRLLLRVQKQDSGASIWKEICSIHEGKTELVQIDLRRCLQET
jgi:hypothetical protein